MIGALGMGSTAVNLISGLINGIVGNKAHKDYANSLSDVSINMPTSIDEAQAIYTDKAGRGLAGKNTIIQDLLASESNSVSQAKTVADSPSALLNAIVKLNGNTQAGIRNLGIKDSQAKDANSELLARFLSTVKAPAETRINQFEADKKIAIAKEKMAGTKELLNGIEGGIGSALSGYGETAKLDYLNTKNDALKKYWGI